MKALFGTCMFVAACSAFTQEETLYNFETDTQGWWTFSGEASIALSAEKPDGTSSQALKVVYKYEKPGSYLGMGIEPKWALGTDDLSAYSGGGISLSLKSDVEISVAIELRMAEKETYVFTIPKVGTTLTVFTIPFSDFKSNGKTLDLKVSKLKHLVIIPRVGGFDEHTLFVDDVKLSASLPAKKE